MYKLRFLCLLACSLVFTPALSARTVTKYIVTTQEERESTRFTLTEWLRIKERMRMMDVWLAMFSEPTKDHFKPELSLFYGKAQGFTLLDGIEQNSQNAGADLTALTNRAEYGRGQLWLTNIISSTFGVRTLNVDLGVETFLRRSQVQLPEINLLNNNIDNFNSSLASVGKSYLRYNTLNLRIFGSNIQHSSLVLKYGEFTSQRAALPYAKVTDKNTFKDKVMGGELQLYLSHWLGFEGNYLVLASKATASGLTGESKMYDYGLFLEISLLRFMGGITYEQWEYKYNDDKTLQEINAGRYFGVKVHF